MEISSSPASISGQGAAQALREISGAELVTQTLDRLNTSQSLSGPKVDADYQLQKTVLAAAGIGQKLDITA